MKKLGSIILCVVLVLSGCSKEMVITLDTDSITVNVHEELSDETILSYVKCDKLACPEEMVFDIFKNDLDLGKVGSYTIDVMIEGSGYPLRINVVDKENPIISIAPFEVLQYEKIIWDQAMLDRINLTLNDNATAKEPLFKSLKVSELNTDVVGIQEVTFTIKDASGNATEQKVNVNVIAKPVVIVPPLLPPVLPPVVEPVPEENPTEEEVDEPQTADPTPEEPSEEVETSTKITKTTAKDILSVLSTSTKYEILYISQTWCSHCHAFIKTLSSYLDARENIQVLELVLDLEPSEDINEVDEEGKDIAKVIYPDFETMKKTYEMDFVGTPCLYIFKDKKIVASLIGNESMENLALFLDEIDN